MTENTRPDTDQDRREREQREQRERDQREQRERDQRDQRGRDQRDRDREHDPNRDRTHEAGVSELDKKPGWSNTEPGDPAATPDPSVKPVRSTAHPTAATDRDHERDVKPRRE